MLDKYIDDYEARYSPNLLNSQEQYEFRKNYNFLLSMFVSTTSPTLMHRMRSGIMTAKMVYDGKVWREIVIGRVIFNMIPHTKWSPARYLLFSSKSPIIFKKNIKKSLYSICTY